MNNQVLFTRLGVELGRHFGHAQEEVFIVAPFITLGAFNAVIAGVPSNTPIRVVTRWLDDELAIGISDCRIYESLSERGEPEIYLLDSLHAKYYRSDDGVIVGSANVTSRALNDGPGSNFEILTYLSVSSAEVKQFEDDLVRNAKRVSLSMFEEALTLQTQMRNKDPQKLDPIEDRAPDFAVVLNDWLPSIQNPRELYQNYKQFMDVQEVDALELLDELTRWRPPTGLDEPTFDQFVADRLSYESTVLLVNEFLSSKVQRFGAVARFLAKELHLETRGSQEWSNLLEWLLYFRRSDYSYERNPHSELVQYLGT